ncbi:MAG: MerC domain-containing protein, partial [Chitinophagaceae bacterium]|nr:MerC domain-containing protein [Chitinophagaceae bacterium]
MFKINYDALGIAASVACAIHCAVLPLVLTSLPVLGTNIIDNPGFEYLMIIIALAIG